MDRKEILAKAKKNIEKIKADITKIELELKYEKECISGSICPGCGENIKALAAENNQPTVEFKCDKCGFYGIYLINDVV